MKIYSTLAFVLLLSGVNLLAQSPALLQADRLYDTYSYSKAIPLYQKAMKKAKDQASVADAHVRLADCYRLTNDYVAAETWYRSAVQNINIESAAMLNFANVLHTNGKCEEALQWFRTYKKRNPDDSRADAGIASCNGTIESGRAPYSMRNLTLNSAANDMAPVYLDEKLLLFSSSREIQSEVCDFDTKKTDGWTGQKYLNLYLAEEWEGNTDSVTLLCKPANFEYHDGPSEIDPLHGNLYISKTVITKNSERRLFDVAIFKTQKVETGWEIPEQIEFPTLNGSIMHPAFTVDGNAMIFASNDPGGVGGFDLYISKRDTDSWGTPQNLGDEINTPGDDLFPNIDRNGTLWFASDGHKGYGALDIYNVRYRGEGKWSGVRNAETPLNSPWDDFGINWQIPEEYGLLVSNRPGGKGGDDLYRILKRNEPVPVVDAAPLKLSSALVMGRAYDQYGSPVTSGAAVIKKSGSVAAYKTISLDKNGYFIGLLPTDLDFEVEIDNINYVSETADFSSKDYLQGQAMGLIVGMKKIELGLVVEMEDIYFDFDGWNIRTDAEDGLYKLLKMLQDRPDLKVELSSHTDARGPAEYNEMLSGQRAESAANWLIERGISLDRLVPVGYGETQLRNNCGDEQICSEVDHQFNRRTEFKVIELEENE